jgi:dTMP kinase
VSGCFITFEGIEGCGKTTQIARIEQYFRGRGHEVVLTREPGGTPIAEKIRDLLLDPENDAMVSTAELLLYAAARAQHLEERILPALQRGAVVLCDRFADSTTAYQGGGRGLSRTMLRNLHEIATQGRSPDLTFVLDLPVSAGAQRRAGTTLDRIERESAEFHERVRNAFLDIAREEPHRVVVVDAAQPVEVVTAAMVRVIEHRATAP